ncbi:zinc finger protein [Haloactinomyces albus]|uniref:Zinc-finger n=1 Tax=Haloactinomyces albus TaxID=1352928 RepID=A0AAE4CL52_9ACTN|nr:zinc finger protein [Haloactinomyces albus]MDR7301001.1 hypothetical protein [Haloactinomyces albus]
MPHPFTWVPADQARHASTDSTPNGHGYPTGTEVMTLCEQQLTADNSENAWFWGTCPDCNVAAHELTGVEIPTASKAAER